MTSSPETKGQAQSEASTNVPASDSSDHPWAVITLPSYPFQGRISEDFAEHIAGEMSMVHNIIIRSLNSIWVNAPNVGTKGRKDGSVAAFVGYSLVALHNIHEHHDTEEAIFFPVLKDSGLGEMVAENVEQHRVFHEAMAEFEAYLRNVRGGTETYDAEKLRKLLKAFADPLVRHLHDEINTLRPEVMHSIDKAVLQKLWKDLDAHIQSQGGLFTTIPFMITAHNPSDAANWPPFPGPLRWLVKSVFYRVHSSYWKFAPYTLSGQPQTFSP
ncbi:hypothetical protein D9611_014659 [Ephemerocybe angulata]|uniref:Hemerythrin-like domain-containing protein n=1 Tax=Ephemerocybe angulata TaxID=980116 RepID=A0A8H5AQZ8_9AGAR|nr:hypothetical protein D9611_014659 [Tulosesus angulatus]